MLNTVLLSELLDSVDTTSKHRRKKNKGISPCFLFFMFSLKLGLGNSGGTGTLIEAWGKGEAVQKGHGYAELIRCRDIGVSTNRVVVHSSNFFLSFSFFCSFNFISFCP